MVVPITNSYNVCSHSTAGKECYWCGRQVCKNVLACGKSLIIICENDMMQNIAFFHEEEVYSYQQPNVRVVKDLSFCRISVNRIFSPSHIITVRSSLFLELITNVFASSVNFFLLL